MALFEIGDELRIGRLPTDQFAGERAGCWLVDREDRSKEGEILRWNGVRPQIQVAFALATLTYYAILMGLRIHHVVIWGAVVVAGLLPIWANLGPDRDPVAMMLLGVVLMISGILDQRFLAHSFGPALHSDFEHINVGR